MYWNIKAIVGKNKVGGRVTAGSKQEAIRRGLAAVHAAYPHSLVVLYGAEPSLLQPRPQVTAWLDDFEQPKPSRRVRRFQTATPFVLAAGLALMLIITGAM